MKILYILFFFLIVSCSDDNKSNKHDPIVGFSPNYDLFCSDVLEMPDGAVNDFMRVTDILPNPVGSDSSSEQIRIHDYKKNEYNDFDWYKLLFEGTDEELTFNMLERVFYIDKDNARCSSVILTSNKEGLFSNSGGKAYLVRYYSEDTVQIINYGPTEEGEWLSLTKISDN